MNKLEFQKIHQEVELGILEKHYGVKGREKVSMAISHDQEMPFGIKITVLSLVKSIQKYGYLI